MKFSKWRKATKEGCKRCPGCKTYIEKNEGCIHMTCIKCRHEFCWKCLSKWNSRCTSTRVYCSIRGMITWSGPTLLGTKYFNEDGEIINVHTYIQANPPSRNGGKRIIQS